MTGLSFSWLETLMYLLIWCRIPYWLLFRYIISKMQYVEHTSDCKVAKKADDKLHNAFLKNPTSENTKSRNTLNALSLKAHFLCDQTVKKKVLGCNGGLKFGLWYRKFKRLLRLLFHILQSRYNLRFTLPKILLSHLFFLFYSSFYSPCQ